MIRLNSFIAKTGLCSRRKADILISQGKIKLNDNIITQLGVKIEPLIDKVEYKGKILRLKTKNSYILLNKPKGYITTTKDERGRKTVLDLLEPAMRKRRLFPVGRLDKDTEGLLILTDDGELANKLMHPSGKIEKKYEVALDKPFKKDDSSKLTKGITDEGELLKVKSVKILGEEKVEVVLIEGKKREIKRIFRAIGYKTQEIKRTEYAFLTLEGLKKSEYRELSINELKGLKTL